MNRNDVRLLQSIRGYPAVSILLPTHRTSPDNLQDPIRVKNMVQQATERLLAEFSKRDVEPLLTRLESLVAHIDYRYTLDGLTLFVNRDLAREFYLPFTVKERMIIGETFATRDLVLALNRSPRYWVLVLSEKPTRLYEGLRDDLMQVAESGFPMTHEGPGTTEPLPGGFGIRKSAYRDERQRQFFRQVDAAFGQMAAADPLPVVLVGIDRYRAFFNEVSANKDQIVATLTGSHDKTSSPELAKLVWPLMQDHLAHQRHQVLIELEKAVGARQYASGIGEVWQAVQEGRGATCLVEQDYHCPAQLDASSLHLTPADDPTAPDVIDDAVDDLIVTVLDKGGRVVFVDRGALEPYQRIALITRY
jgi:Bacterial archaeo-eukaryotic release factor family 3